MNALTALVRANWEQETDPVREEVLAQIVAAFSFEQWRRGMVGLLEEEGVPAERIPSHMARAEQAEELCPVPPHLLPRVKELAEEMMPLLKEEMARAGLLKENE